jgi:thioredoxin-dependent peroxiredoxin
MVNRPGLGVYSAVMLDVGKKCPAFRLEASKRGEVCPPATAGTKRFLSAADFAGHFLVLYFYPKDDTPGCTREAQGFQAWLETFAGLGTAVVGVSRDSAAKHQRFAEKYGLTFPLLSDPDLTAHRAYGAWGEKMLYGKKVEGVLRTTVLIDPHGRIQNVFRNVKVAGHPEAVLAALRECAQATSASAVASPAPKRGRT